MAVKLALALCCLIGAVACLESGEWLAYKARHGKSYESQVEDSMRRSIFEANKQKIEQFNAEESKQAGYRMGLNHLSDRTEAELEGLLGARKPSYWHETSNTPEGEQFLARILGNRSEPAPDSIDWRTVPGRVTGVKDQAFCSASWAFSTTGLLEGQQLNVTRGKELISLSEQQLIDCAVEHGCSSNWPSVALKHINQNGGIESAKAYPYTQTDDLGCVEDWTKSIMTTEGPIALIESEQELKLVVAKYGPVSVVFHAGLDFTCYLRGVFKARDCASRFPGLVAALVVGYGTDPKEGDFWLVKNSWSDKWGESGYFRIARNANNMCGIASKAVIAAFKPT